MNTDLHTHSVHSFDGACPAAELCRAAESQEVQVLAITDHCDVNAWEEQGCARSIPESFQEIQETRRALAPGGVLLLAGIELGEPLEVPERAAWALSQFDWDFVIGSIHNSPGDPDFYKSPDMDDEGLAAWMGRYYRALLQTAEEADFDTLAHITYPYRYLNVGRSAPFPSEPFDGLADQVFRALIRRGKALELNTSSLRRSPWDRELNVRYFRRYRELGGELVTVGSDAHRAEDVGRGLEDAKSLLRSAGFTHTVWYQNRTPRPAPLDEQ